MADKSAPTEPAPAEDGARSRHSQGETVAGKYHLSRQIGRGGMGEVWAATHEELKTDVAIKFVDPGPDADPETVELVLERFRFEAQITARLSRATKHIVAVYDAGTSEGSPYLVMDLVEGKTLEDELDRSGPLPIERFAEILTQVAEALRAAHEVGVLHRDLKPSNIMVSEVAGRPFVRLTDFGVAKAIRSVGLDHPKKTTDGYLVGSPAYMSPEQLRAEGDLGTSSDIWSLGIVAYELLTGVAPFSGASMTDLIVTISTRPFALPSTVRAQLPRALDGWFRRALAKEPGERFSSIDTMVSDFKLAIAAKSPKRGAAVAAGAGAVGVGALGLGIQAARRGRLVAIAGGALAVATAVGVVGWRLSASTARAEGDPIEAHAEPPTTARTPTETTRPRASTEPDVSSTLPEAAAPHSTAPAARSAHPPRVAVAPPTAPAAPTASATAAPRTRKEIDQSEIQ